MSHLGRSDAARARATPALAFGLPDIIPASAIYDASTQEYDEGCIHCRRRRQQHVEDSSAASWWPRTLITSRDERFFHYYSRKWYDEKNIDELYAWIKDNRETVRQHPYVQPVLCRGKWVMLGTVDDRHINPPYNKEQYLLDQDARASRAVSKGFPAFPNISTFQFSLQSLQQI